MADTPNVPEHLSTLPWKYVNTNGRPVHGMSDWIEDAHGNVVVDNVGHIDGPFIVAAANALYSPAMKETDEKKPAPAIGMKEDGTRWLAPCNWVAPAELPKLGAWAEIERTELLFAYPEEHDE